MMTLYRMMMMKKKIINLEVEEEVSNYEEVGENPPEFEEISDISDNNVPLANIYFAKDKDKNVMKWRNFPPQPRNMRTRA